MYLNFVSCFRDPYSLEPLEFHIFEKNDKEVLEGIFLHSSSLTIYPIIQGVPVFIKNRVLKSFANRYKNELRCLLPNSKSLNDQIISKQERFSFSDEWNAADSDKVNTIWGLSIEDRLKMHYSDLDYDKSELKDKIHLDVGCGNGILCKKLAENGAIVFGIDYSTSVWNANKNMKHPNTCYIQADLHNLPFKDDFFDIVYSNGVLHHTPNTENAFKMVSRKVKKQGKFYVWLYARSKAFRYNLYFHVTDVIRDIVNKFPGWLQKLTVEFILLNKILYNRISKQALDIPNARTDIYDTLTPQYKFYHTFSETQEWCKKYGFEPPRQTHLNLYGFGILAIKQP